MKKIYALLIVVAFYGCSAPIQERLDLLNGYWEIEKVMLPDGTSKTYTISQTIDYIAIQNDTAGVRVKVQPKLDGGFTTSGDEEHFSVDINGDDLLLKYKTPLSEWSEKLIKLEEDHFSVVNEQNIRYEYKRYQPFNLE